MRIVLTLFLQLAVVPSLFALPRLAFARMVPAQYDLGSDDVAIVSAIGDTDSIATFVDVFVEQTARAGTLHVKDATGRGQNVLSSDEAALKKLRKEHPAAVYIGVKEFTCSTQVGEGEGSTHDVDGNRIRRKQTWVDATCQARIVVINASDMKRVLSFQVKGEGTSPRVETLSDEERDIAVLQAARYAAVDASEKITPRRVRESVTLDDDAPAFDEGFAMIQAEQLPEARSIWEAEAKKNAGSAALHYNLAAVCEALGDLKAARAHYTEARKLEPNEPRYRAELEQFMRRNTLK
ncbi:MAG TPA: hypothetical protein VMU84_20530 [Thermoanaerobaculia bacterium]|nr:hypothetical protein [Thermoanaerobaculia bacterium]